MITINQLDPSQKYILKSLLNHDIERDKNIFVIYGPPGTGKSHLIVSLLFELAVKKKKILFVSQNTEALDVVDRMISKLEKELIDNKYNENYISLRNFCLMLTCKEHKTLKYIKEQNERILSKSGQILTPMKMKFLIALRTICHT
jgi:AAA+ ATPase superfamily predicted ATPase